MSTTVTRTASRTGLKLALLAFSQFIVTLDYNVVFVALPDIGRDLGFTPQSVQWVVSAYVVALGGLLLFGGRAADRLGARRMFILGMVIYALSSLVGGLSTHAGLLVAARAAQGVGGALLTPATLRLIFMSFPVPADRNRALALWGAMGGAGLSAGALIGGLLTNYVGWQWVFFINVPLALGAALVTPRILAADPPPAAGRRSFDIPGALVVTAGVTLVVFGLVSGPEVGWTTLRGLGSVLVGAVLVAIFVLIEARSADPLAPLRMFRHRPLVTTMVVIFVYQGTLATVYYAITTYMQEALGFSPLQAGLGFLPPTLLSVVAASKLTAPVLSRWGVRTTLFVGTFITGVGIVVLGLGFTAHGSYWTILPGLVIWSIGGALAFPTLFAAAAIGVSPLEQGVASALASTSRHIGGAVGLAALVAIATAGLDVHGGVAQDSVAIAHGLRNAGLVAGIVTVLGAFIALALPRPVPPPPPAPEPATAPSTDTVAQNG